MPNVPHDIPIPPTLVLDLEETLVSSTWDRRYGWRHAKRPGVDKFLHDMAQYYEIVLYSPSIDAIAEPVVNSLDKTGCIMHRLYRDATYFKDGVHVKDLNRLNRNVNKMVILDDDPEAVKFNSDNLILVKPYTDPMDRNDNTLEKITPFLIELAREGYKDIPSILRHYQGMDADEIADEHARRIDQFKTNRQRKAQRGLGGWARHEDNLPPPEMSPGPTGATQQLTSKDLVGPAPQPQGGGMVEWMQRRAQEKEEQQNRKMEKWNEVMLKKQQAKREQQLQRDKAQNS
jgi:import inner membrane translocase subunit TIM50